jgi:hypothetical protein
VKGGVGSAATTPRPAAAPRQEVRGERRGSRGQYGCACGMDGAPGGEYRERERREAGCGEGGSGVGGQEKGRGRGGLGLGGCGGVLHGPVGCDGPMVGQVNPFAESPPSRLSTKRQLSSN